MIISYKGNKEHLRKLVANKVGKVVSYHNLAVICNETKTTASAVEQVINNDGLYTTAVVFRRLI